MSVSSDPVVLFSVTCIHAPISTAAPNVVLCAFIPLQEATTWFRLVTCTTVAMSSNGSWAGGTSPQCGSAGI